MSKKFQFAGYKLKDTLLTLNLKLGTCNSRMFALAAEKFDKGCGGVRERRALSVRGPDDALVREAADGDSCERAALQLFGDAHARDESYTDLLLHEALYGLDCGEFNGDVERRVLARKRLYDFPARGRLNVVREERLFTK